MSVYIISVTHHEGGLRTVPVYCECRETHEVVWPKDVVAFNGELPCGKTLERVELPAWCFGHRTGYRKFTPERPIVTSEDREGMNDSAIDNPALNWTE